MEQWISIESANFTPGVMKILGQLLFAKWRVQEPRQRSQGHYLFLAGDGNLITDNPNTGAWWNRISERTSWQKVRGNSTAA